MKRCERGHYYDAGQHSDCPYCQASVAGNNETVSFSTGNHPQKTTVLKEFEKTIGFFKEKTGREPVVGWLVCTVGNHFGTDFRLKSGRNFIGRSRDMDIALEGEPSVSRERHATIVYEPKQNIFLAQPGDSSSLFYLNGNVVLTPSEIRKNDRLQIGDVELMLIPCCDGAFAWRIEDTE